jgi:hypothetical protein
MAEVTLDYSGGTVLFGVIFLIPLLAQIAYDTYLVRPT